MTTARVRIFKRLEAIGFQVSEEKFEPFGQKLPFVVGSAWDERTAQLALVAEIDDTQEEDAWRQILFAAAGLRHHVATDGRAALASPLVLLLVDEIGEKKIRVLVEDMNRHYAVFTRVDLSLVRRDRMGDDNSLDDALAPLLPRCRDAKDLEISKADVRHFWQRLRETVGDAASDLDDTFAGYRKMAGEVIAKKLIGDLADRPELPPPTPLTKLRLKDFRSFVDDEIALSPVTVLHGANGSGKSAALEALELCWAGTSQRKPSDVESADYARHLPYDGGPDFEVEADGPPVTGVLGEPTVELVRCILTQDAVSSLVEKSPEKRYEWLLTITGLELPEVDQRTEGLVREAKKEVDLILREAGLAPLRAISSDGLKHLQSELRGSFASRLPRAADFLGVEELLAKASQGSYVSQDWTEDRALLATIEGVDEMVASTPFDEGLNMANLEDAAAKAKKAADQRRQRARRLDELIDAIRPLETPDEEQPKEVPDDQLLPPVPRRIAVRWLGHVRSLEEIAGEFHEQADEIADEDWAANLDAYASALDGAAKGVPAEELEAIAGATIRRSLTPPQPIRAEISEDGYRAAGFSRALEHPLDSLLPLEEFSDLLQGQAAELDGIAAGLEDHPSREFSAHAERVLGAMCRFEVARRLRPRKGYKSPVAEASEIVVADLLKGRVTPVVRELIAALVRFEWYFKPPVITSDDNELVLSGIATSRDDLDARLMLNAAERSVVGLAWFLALHLLQPQERRRVLAIDDPSAAFDLANQSAFISTLRAVVRLSRPEQVVAITHDAATAESLADELGPVGDWPASTSRVRFQRDKEDVSVSFLESEDATPRDLQKDLEDSASPATLASRPEDSLA